MERAGGWLFRYRTVLPLPLAVAFLLIPAQPNAPLLLDAAGAALVAGGELVRLWAVRHIGTISRTRSDRLGPLVASGPFAFVRNPLYLGNMALWIGFALSAHVPWMAPVVFLVLALEYHAIVRWEERLLEARRGDEFRAYAARVPRWIPGKQRGGPSAGSAITFSWRETLFSERGTLIAIAVGYLLVWVKVKS
jgi:protein-S-isoprenylcysteine O-methyltransferase Ste14